MDECSLLFQSFTVHELGRVVKRQVLHGVDVVRERQPALEPRRVVDQISLQQLELPPGTPARQ